MFVSLRSLGESKLNNDDSINCENIDLIFLITSVAERLHGKVDIIPR